MNENKSKEEKWREEFGNYMCEPNSILKTKFEIYFAGRKAGEEEIDMWKKSWEFEHSDAIKLKTENEILKKTNGAYIVSSKLNRLIEENQKLKDLLKRSISMFKEVSGYSIPIIEKEIEEALGE